MQPGPSRTSSVTEQHELKRNRHFGSQPDKTQPCRTRRFESGSFTPQLAEDETTAAALHRPAQTACSCLGNGAERDAKNISPNHQQP